MQTVSIRPPAEKIGRSRRTFAEGLIEAESPAPTISIRGIAYAVEPLQGDEGEVIVRLVKQGGDGAVYDVVRGPGGHVVCDCPDHLYRAEKDGVPCKHARAVVDAGLFPAPSPALDYAAADATLEGFGYGITRRRKALDVIKAEGSALRCKLVDRQDRAAVQAALEGKGVHRVDAPAPAPAPVVPSPPVTSAGAWDLTSLDLGTDGPAPDEAWTPAAVAAFMRDARDRQEAGETVPGSAIGREVDECWWQGHTLGRLGVDAEAPAEWKAHERAAFRDGMHWGRIDEEADRQAAVDDELAMLATCNGPAERDLW